MKNPRSSRVWFLGLLSLALVSNTVSSQVMLSPVAVVGTDLGTLAESTALTNMINQSGIQTPFVSGTTVFDTYFAIPNTMFADANFVNNWQSVVDDTLPLQGYVDFDLGAVYQINKIGIWNRSLKDVTVKIFNDLNGPEQVAGSFTLVSHLSFPFSYAPDVLSFATPHQGRYVRLAIDSAHIQSTGDRFTYAIIGEVVVSAAPIGPVGLPTVKVILNPNGDVTVTFTGTLQTAITVDRTFTDVTGNPQSAYTLTKASLPSQQYFRSRSN
ncbi:MAG: hypothetical protein ABI651_17010 [Verrucomicrobiota bacterium]